MRLSQFSIITASFLDLCAAHGNVTSPPARLPGPGMVSACGSPAVAAVLADGTTPLEDVPAAGPNCKLDLCRGAVFADNVANVQTMVPGQVVQFRAILPIPHEGPMNVSIVDAATNTLLGPPLIQFASYADENLPQLPANNTAFAVRVPDMQGRCTQPGECVMQWFWFGRAAQQTYESCVDFVMAPARAAVPAVGATGATGTRAATRFVSRDIGRRRVAVNLKV